ncbi:hypothetical protein H1P_3390002 [Hyella patelloides LEGE 07179]|uniref:Uncharacterized protein n=1 Tax=Hyella patelloides LEGE 07179 TaxID=945734 RepID=A0A563VVI7_9CYAN|nr:hypothetical protein [Hyella patelloides]VEP15469.1 hypothetical protein H1P_3390002 [Hyella patelloides LEGE 07179]
MAFPQINKEKAISNEQYYYLLHISNYQRLKYLVKTELGMDTLTLDFQSIELTDEQFYQLCKNNQLTYTAA